MSRVCRLPPAAHTVLLGLPGRRQRGRNLRHTVARDFRPEMRLIRAAESGGFLRLSAAPETHRPKDGLSVGRLAVRTKGATTITTGGVS